MNNYKQAITEVILGTGKNSIKVGGNKTMPFDSEPPVNEPVIAFEIIDKIPNDPPEQLKEAWEDVWFDASLWAEKCVKEYDAKVICINLLSTKPDEGESSSLKSCETVLKIMEKVEVPIIIKGSGIAHIDNEILPEISKAAKNKKLLIGSVTQENYKKILESVMLNGHSIFAESPIDINIASSLISCWRI